MAILFFLLSQTILFCFMVNLQVEETGRGSAEYNKLKYGLGGLLITAWVLFIFINILGLFI